MVRKCDKTQDSKKESVQQAGEDAALNPDKQSRTICVAYKLELDDVSCGMSDRLVREKCISASTLENEERTRGGIESQESCWNERHDDLLRCCGRISSQTKDDEETYTPRAPARLRKGYGAAGTQGLAPQANPSRDDNERAPLIKTHLSMTIESSSQDSYAMKTATISCNEKDSMEEKASTDADNYLAMGIMERAFPERFFALVVTLLVEIPTLFIISGGSDQLCQLIGRQRYQLLIAFLPLTSAISGNVGEFHTSNFLPLLIFPIHVRLSSCSI
uniref:Uncharacterized protein n=1 Tax=Odontella aurita TaxID=265563 RepID=A0A7S4KDE9_9STRA|mmetsp:Transcript_9692/g.29001  ORF Transcript_9692/g.29001 Transcript_9692/m.29001 type:complete len:275 (+) Transcript_9692:329-1153(+)